MMVSLWVAAVLVAASWIAFPGPASAAVDESPQGDVSVVVADDGLVQVVGWAFDRSDFGRDVRTVITVNGLTFSTTTAWRPSPYLWPYGVAGQHAFWTAFRLAPGQYDVCVTWTNVGPGSDTSAPCSTVVVSDARSASSPQGDLSVVVDDANARLIVLGWAFDHSDLYASIGVDVFVDGVSRGTWTASGASPYLAPYGVPGSHAFFGAVGIGSGGHRVCVVARDRPPGGDAIIGCRDVTASVITYDPEGALRVSMNGNGSINVTGYAFDRSDLGSPIQVGVFQSGTLTAAPVASAASPEMAPYGLGNRGVDVRLPPITRSAPISVCVIGLNIGTGSNQWLVCTDVDPRGTRPVDDQTSAGSLTVLVNKRTPLNPRQYAPPLWPMSALGLGGGEMLRPEAAVAMRDLAGEAGRWGIPLAATSGYRSFTSQAAIHDRFVRQLGRDAAEAISARPGYSEHQTGLAIDVSSPGAGCDLVECFGSTAAGRFVADHAWQFGFIVRYPQGYTGITGYDYEPWHLRYVGRDVAREMHDGGVATYEQYLGLPAAPGY
ncbi:hypothetical protein GCM10010462_27180 [Microbacterium dextranolyticum]|uniref:D-alanyl-D-alanine carboxypeptidase-like core domain-containing protein n=1 Tax=Microbacterium dextranolyticum TaxID=36806 RepID=A0A9W6HNG7_9MICO|nr:hypothetical protein GCM10017591_24900 [Microbacterium dextranolyticum]